MCKLALPDIYPVDTKELDYISAVMYFINMYPYKKNKGHIEHNSWIYTMFDDH